MQGLKPTMELLKTGDTNAVNFYNEKAIPLYNDFLNTLSRLIQLRVDAVGEEYNLAQSRFQTILYISIGLIVFGLLITALVSNAITRGILKSIILAQNVAEAVAQGNLTSKIDTRVNDETGAMLQAMQTMQDTLVNFAQAQQVMAKKHADGWISEEIDTSQFKGAYQDIAKSMNDLVQSHIAVKMKVVEVVTQYSKGNFEPDMDRLPAEKAKITEAIDAVKASFLAVSNEVSIIASAGVQGNFSQRANTDNFDFLFKTMLTDLNNLVGAVDNAFNGIIRISGAISDGDLTQSFKKEYPGLYGLVGNSLNKTVASLNKFMSEIKDSTETVNSAAREIAAGNNDLSLRTERQAASLEETAASMQELTSTVQANSENASHANELAHFSTDIARRGVAVIERVVARMEDINDSSRKVVNIIDVIDGIAFQTNILALNAAVEAARAGDQGRGFAVVATEVRNLAQRSASAAGEIKALIGDSVEKVEDGANLVARAGKTMEEIVSSIQEVTVAIAQITTASFEQTAGIQQVNHAITEMDNVTQQNAALVEQAAAAAESLEEQARTLHFALQHFSIDETQITAIEAKKPATDVKPKTTTSEKKQIILDIDLDNALKKHSAFKMTLRSAIVNKEPLDAVKMKRVDCCDFGKWLLNDKTQSQVGNLSSYQECVERHTDLHHSAAKIAEVINAKRYDEANQMLNSADSDFLKASQGIGSAIMRLIKDTDNNSVDAEKKTIHR
jgi:methyl-accepting chemotaxis protein